MGPVERMRADLELFVGWVATAEGSSRLLELPGVTGAIVPAVPERSVLNSLVSRDADALERALPAIEAAYDAAGVRAWTVWVMPGDERTRELLGRAGNVLDGDPLAMVCDLDPPFGGQAAYEPPPVGDLDWSDDPALLADVMAINDASYPYDGTPFSDGFHELAAGGHVYVARLDGVPASGLVTFERDGSAGVYWVATLPEARGRQLAWRLLGQALADARERGCTVSTLQATKMGAPIYERLGYRSFGPVEMWERRKTL